MKSIGISHVFFTLIFVFLLISCNENDPVSSQEEHFEAIGTAIYDATGALAVSILRGNTTDTLKIENGILSDHFDVKFYNENEEIVEAPVDEHITLSYEIADTTIASWWQHPGEEGGFEFHLRGKKVGITTIELFIQHEGHNDYRSGLIPLRVQ